MNLSRPARPRAATAAASRWLPRRADGRRVAVLPLGFAVLLAPAVVAAQDVGPAGAPTVAAAVAPAPANPSAGAAVRPVSALATAVGVAAATVAQPGAGASAAAATAVARTVAAGTAPTASTAPSVPSVPSAVAGEERFRFVIRWRDGSDGSRAAAAAFAAGGPDGRLQALSAAGESLRTRLSPLGRSAGLALAPVRLTSGGDLVVAGADGLDRAQAEAAAARLRAADPAIEHVDLDVRVSPTVLPSSPPSWLNDPAYAQQWGLHPRARSAGGADFETAWRRGTGGGVAVAVLDTGTTRHPDAQGDRELPGHDFLASVEMAGDGGGRDADPTDPGDFCATRGSGSSWHGDAVAGVIGAVAGNQRGIAGAAPSVRLMHVRVLGRCGGWLSDAADAIAWLAGRPVPGVAAPAQTPRVLNLSLGGRATCGAYLQEAVDAAVARGIVVVVAAGNDGQDTVSAPANCRGVVAVAAHTASGDLAGYSNHGGQTTLTAPGGGACRQQSGAACLPWAVPTVATLGARGLEGHGATRHVVGTSFAAPHVAAAAALLLAARPEMTPADVRAALVASAAPHPAGSFCATPGRCGAGMLDAAAALDRIAQPPLRIEPASARTVTGRDGEPIVARGGTLALRAVGAAGRTVTWRQRSGPAAVLAASGSGDSATLRAGPQSGVVELEASMPVDASSGGMPSAPVTVTARLTVRVNDAPAPAPRDLAGTAGVPFTSPPAVATDADGDPLAYAPSATRPAPAGVAVDERGVVRWSTPVPGAHVFEVAARDPHGQVGVQLVNLRIGAAVVNRPPALITGQRVEGAVGTVLRGLLRAADPDGDPVTFALVAGPAGLTVSPAGELTWRPASAATATVTVEVRDRAGAAARGTVSVVAVQPNRPPVVLPIGPLTVPAGVPLNVAVTAADPDGQPLALAVAGGPAGLTVAAGRLQWPAPVAGRWSVTVTATDPLGLRAQAVVALTVVQPNRPPVIAAVPAASLVVPAGRPWTLRLQSTDADGDRLAWALVGAPAGLTVGADTGLLSWPSPRAGTHAFRVVVADGRGGVAQAEVRLVVR